MSLPKPQVPDSQSSSFSVNPASIGTTSSESDLNDHQTVDTCPHNAPTGFVDRRSSRPGDSGRPERRQFGSSHSGLSDAGRELALAIDQYKVQNHRRYLTCDEMLKVLSDLGYAKQSPGSFENAES